MARASFGKRVSHNMYSDSISLSAGPGSMRMAAASGMAAVSSPRGKQHGLADTHHPNGDARGFPALG